MPQTTDRPVRRRVLPVVRDRRGSGMRRMLGAVPADVRMLRAISVDVAHAADPRHLARRPPAADPLALRDPEYIARTLPALRVMADVWFRADVRGLENIPARGPVLLVGNHSGGTLIADTFVFAQAFYDHFGPEREFFQLAHDLVFKVPGIRAMLTPYGTVPASPQNMRRALARDAALLVYPGGDHETYRASWHSAEIDFAHRTGFVRLA
ncbi:MAG: 1-acyl-sn-glycerol-3-phosphate acyltransferase, partial [Xanthobacteraceae bacterium]